MHHADNQREVAYDRTSHFGRLDRGLNDAAAKGWVLIDMKQDWREVFESSPTKKGEN